MKIAVINPNSTVSMTDKIAAAARAVAPDDEIVAITCHDSPPAIQGPEDDAICRPFVLAEVAQAEADGADAVVIACFDDPALAEARAAAAIPVLGIGEAAFHAAMLLGQRFSVVTTMPVAIPIIEGNIARYGISGACARVRAAGIKVLDLEDPATGAQGKVSAEIARACADEAPGAVVLGCAGMADLAALLEGEHGVKVIDGVAAATVFAQALVRMRGA
jgi:allantoin racemase